MYTRVCARLSLKKSVVLELVPLQRIKKCYGRKTRFWLKMGSLSSSDYVRWCNIESFFSSLLFSNQIPRTREPTRTEKRKFIQGIILLFGLRPNTICRVFEIACFDSKLQQARNTCERKQAKRRGCLPCERLVQGKKHAGKKALLAGYLIPLWRSQNLATKKHNSQRWGDKEINSDEHVNATQR